MKIAQNPLSKNLTKIFGNKHNKEFKDKANEIIKKIESRYSEGNKCKLTDESIKNWIAQKKGNEKFAHRWPSIALLIELADALKIEVWDFFIDYDWYLNLQAIDPIKKRIIEKILTLEEADRLISAEHAVDDQLEIENLRKSKAPHKEISYKNMLINLIDKKS